MVMENFVFIKRGFLGSANRLNRYRPVLKIRKIKGENRDLN